MATPAPSNKVKEKEYTNWLKVTLALYYMKSGLHNFIQTEVDCLHQSLKQTIYGGQAVPLPPCSMCNDKLLKINKHTGTWTFQNQCKSYCDVWLHELLKLHVNKKSERIYWNNSKISSWPFKPWECAKVFMPRGQPPSSDGPAECDAQALMTLLTNCTYFHMKLSPNGQVLTNTISNIRNSVMHAGEMKLSDGDRNKFIQQIIELLEDPVSLKSLEDCKAAVVNIRKIDNDSLDIFFNVDLHMIALNTAVNEVRKELGMQEKKSLENVASLEKEFKHLTEQLTRSFQDVRKDLGDTVNTIKNDVEALNKRTDTALQQQEVLSESMKTMSKCFAEHDERFGIVETKLQEVIGLGQREYNCGGKALPWSLTVKDLEKAWKSIKDFLLEELAPKHMLPYFEKGSLLSVEESGDLCQLPRSEVAEKLLQRIQENLPDGFLCLLHALNETKQEIIVKQLEVKIKETLNPQPGTHNQKTCGKEQSAVKTAEEEIVMKVEVLKGGKQLHRTESSVGNDVKGRIVLEYDMRSVCLKFESGSVIIYLRPLSKHAKETLPFFCQHGGMKNFVLDLLKRKDIFSSLPEGEISIHIQVSYNKDVAFEDAGDYTWMVENDPPSQHDSFTVTDNLHMIQQNLLLQYGTMVEEIEPLQFQDTFVNRGILDNSFFEKLKMTERRRGRAAQFLNQVMKKGSTALAALVYALRNSGNDVLAKRLCTVQNISLQFSSEGQVDDSCIEVVQEVSKTHAEVDLLWSCQLIVAVKKNEDGPVIPVEILRMDDKSLQLYKKALHEGKEKVYNLRVMVVGQFGVGKTTLIKRLLEKHVDISERKSTEGIDVYKHCCKISLETGEWIVQHEDSDQLSRLHRLMKLFSEPDQKPDARQEQEGHREVVNERETTPEVCNTHMSDIGSSSSSDQEDQLTYSKPDKLSFVKMDGGCGVAKSDQETSTVTVTKSEAESSKKEKKDAVIEILSLINENAENLDKDTVKYALLSIWDFAGQYAFYTTHQTFLSSHALYLLVIDLSQQIKDLIKDDKCFLDMEGIKPCEVRDLVEIWMNSIHTCASSPQASIPHVILVGTHVDKLSEKSRKEVIDKYFKELRYILKDKPTIHHLMDDIAIDNTQNDPMLETLKRRIFELASQTPHWGKEQPARWLPLEQAIMTLKSCGAKVVARSLIEEINVSGSVRIQDSDELDLFLRFHHEMGTILYFSIEGLREKIMLDPQWLIDALKSLITAEEFIRKYPAFTSRWYEFKETGKLTLELIDAIWTDKNHQDFHDNKDHILLLMEKLNIIARPRSFTEDGMVKEEDYYLAPCMLQQATPKEIISPESDPEMENTSIICFVSTGKFLPPPVFHRLLGACLGQWPIATQKSKNLIYCGCCVFNLDPLHRLTLYFKDYVIFVQVTRMKIADMRLSSDLCSEARNFIFENLSKIIGNLGQSCQFEPHIQCPNSEVESLEGLIAVSLLQTYERVPCHSHDRSHTLASRDLLKFWYEDEEHSVAGSATGPLSSLATSDTDMFMRMAYLLVDVGSQVLRRLFHHHTVTPTCTLDQYLANNRNSIDGLHKWKTLNQSQMDIMFPPSGSTNLENYDITLLTALLTHIVHPLSKKEKKLIKYLKEDRNEIYAHASSCKMNINEYQACWNSVTSKLMSLSNLCGDPNFENQIFLEIQRIQVTTVPAGSYLNILKTWFNRIETVEDELQDLKLRFEAMEGSITITKL